MTDRFRIVIHCPNHDSYLTMHLPFRPCTEVITGCLECGNTHALVQLFDESPKEIVIEPTRANPRAVLGWLGRLTP